MELVRYVAGPGTMAALALVGVLGAARLPVMAAADPPWQPPPCGEARAGAPAGEAWYRLDALLDDQGSLAGQHLTVGLVKGSSRHLDLAAGSFASGPQAGMVLAGEDDEEDEDE